MDIDSTSRYSASAASIPSQQRAPLPLNSTNRVPLPSNTSIAGPPASYERPLYSGPGASYNSAPTGPRAFRTPLPGGQPQPLSSPSTNGLLLPHGARIMVDVPKGPKPKPGFAPIKTTQVAGPPGSVPAPPTSTKAGGIKKFFPGEEEEEEERRKAKEAKERDEKEKAEKERERIAKDKAEAKEREERELEREKERYRTKDRDRYRREDRMDVDEDRYSSSRRDRDRGNTRRDRSRSRSRDRSRERDKERDRKDKPTSDSRDGWLVRNGGEVPPPRVRPLNDDDDARPPLPQPQHHHNGPSQARLPPSGPRGVPSGPRAGTNGGLPTGPASHARPPASYERPPIQQQFQQPQNGFNNFGSSNAVVPGVAQRKWGGAATARPPSGPATPSTPRNGFPSPAPSLTPSRPAQPVEEKGGWTRPTPSAVIPPSTPAPPPPVTNEESGTPPLPARRLPLPPPPPPPPPIEQTKLLSPDPIPEASLNPVEASQPPPVTPSVAPTPIPSIVEPQPPRPTELYERLVQVGEGTYGKVYKAKNVETGNLVALKRIRMEAEKDGFPVTAVREIKLLQNLRHPNVVDLVEMLVSKGTFLLLFSRSLCPD